MRPDDFIRREPSPNQHQPSRPMQKPIQDFRPQNLTPRPMNDFQPQRSAPRPLHPQPTQQQSPQEDEDYINLSTANIQKQPKKKRKIFKSKKVFLPLVVIALLVVGIFAFINLTKDDAKPIVKAHPLPSVKPLEKPDFTVYYPTPMPSGVSTAKGSIAYYKESFTFIIEQNGQKSFFVYEQPAATDPDFNGLKSKLAAPKNFTLSIGQGIEGGLDNGTVTAAKTDKNTIIIINCTKSNCGDTPKDLLSSMQINDDLEHLKQSNP
jgi:hypothetical protein